MTLPSIGRNFTKASAGLTVIILGISLFVTKPAHAAPEIMMGTNGEGEVIFKNNNCVVYYDKHGARRNALPACQSGQVGKADDAMAGYRREQGLDRPVADHSPQGGPPEIIMGTNNEGEVIFKGNNCVVYYKKNGTRKNASPACSNGQLQKADLAMAAYRREQGVGGWQVLGSKAVDHNTETDIIAPPSKAWFKTIRLCVERRAVHFRDFDIVYGNGQKQDVAIKKIIRPGECTRNIDLIGKERHIDRIVMRYETLRDTGPKAHVTVSGR